jgi:hypothetical protein
METSENLKIRPLTIEWEFFSIIALKTELTRPI